MKKITIGQTDIILENTRENQGKIIVSDGYYGAYNFFWGAMSGTIEEFICHINAEYFAGKLCNNMYVFDAKASVKNVRKYIREEMSYELPWYEFMEAQKDLRKEIKKLLGCSCGDEFIQMIQMIPDNIYISDYDEEKEFKEIIEDIFKNEPWHFISEKSSPEFMFLYNLHGKLKKVLSK
jgi:hypothetical protein